MHSNKTSFANFTPNHDVLAFIIVEVCQVITTGADEDLLKRPCSGVASVTTET
tara:strand:- start:1526 stop:1684 length:159 start_codon:yes stop_codon:yes gene_type:complete